MFSVVLSQKANRFLEKLDSHIKERIEQRLKKLADTQIPSDAKFVGRDASHDKIFRLRIGDYRALYKVKHSEKTVLVAKIDKRPRVYGRP